jgi:hypothetical protein
MTTADRGLAEHSDLATALRAEGISCNVIAGFHHGHLSCSGIGAWMLWRR